MNRLNALVSIAGCCLALSGCVTLAASRGLVISNVTVVSPERAAPLQNAHVRILDGRIAQISTHALRGEEEIDGTGRYLVPGLIDGDMPVAEAMERDPRSHLFAGFTTVVDLQGSGERIARWNALDVRPDAYYCGDASFRDAQVRRAPEDVVARIAAEGAICVRSGRDASDVTVDQGRSLVRAAHAASLPVVFRTRGNGNVDIGVDVFVHDLWNGSPTTDARETLERIVGNGATGKSSPTDLVYWYPSPEELFPEQVHFNPYEYVADASSPARPLFGAQAQGLGRPEMARWIDAGASKQQLFRALTLDNARAFGLDDRIGTVEVGKVANLLLLGADPTANLGAYDAIESVLLHGQPVLREELVAHDVTP